MHSRGGVDFHGKRSSNKYEQHQHIREEGITSDPWVAPEIKSCGVWRYGEVAVLGAELMGL